LDLGDWSNRLRPVLLGGRGTPQAASQWGWLLKVWWPVLLMLAVIARESTELFSAANTSSIFREIYEALCGRVSDTQWAETHHIIRKSGHFLGYGTLALTWLRAWLLMWMGWLRLRTAEVWRVYSVVMALACTAAVASLDELHQSFLPGRTGVPGDVLIDTSGAVALICLIAAFWIPNPWRTSDL
jgi:VanZ family protein